MVQNGATVVQSGAIVQKIEQLWCKMEEKRGGEQQWSKVEEKQKGQGEAVVQNGGGIEGEGAAVVQSGAMVQNRAAVVQNGTEMEQKRAKMGGGSSRGAKWSCGVK